MEPVTLVTERLLLRTVGPGDAAAVYAACQDPDIQRWTTIPSPYLREHAEGFTSAIVPAGWREGTAFNFGVFERLPQDGLPDVLGPSDRGEGPLVAMLGIMPRPMGTGEIGFWAVREYRRRGYVAEATRALTHWAFTELGVGRAEWRAEVGNEASRAVAERVGFTIEGVLRAGIIHRGEHRDCVIGSLLPSDVGVPASVPYRSASPTAY
ncbi:GNAT family N-acetyltransferase [Streptomyces tsukubensis]|uniref:GNAT family N-acetyltransferase n=1 Tax=Streptomyces tsukubensis TaxID=83656 RepID=A0A1V4A175_9ACTN|nr:GNAT family protein [Streptomyces tsukubensis]OON72120.1 GNAT family N-acetyltransferase [Streptomyces tsukubensis]QFR93924.1 GNAT family N-acetyltransferase [Streptomyces tsukubensis]